ncbi:MAG: hypothetical protein ACLTCM_11490 [Anaerovoracaceae bacterium]
MNQKSREMKTFQATRQHQPCLRLLCGAAKDIVARMDMSMGLK